MKGVNTSSGFIPTSVVVLAIGHSARDTYRMLAERGLTMTPKPFQFGVRIEHNQEIVNTVQFGPRHDHYEEMLGNADYSLVAHGGHDLFTFCMCAGGHIIPSVSQEGFFCTNGMSLSKRDSPFANSGLVVTVPVEEFGATDVLAGVRLQEKYESLAYEAGHRSEYRSPVQRAEDFIRAIPTDMAPECSYPREVAPCDLRKVLPPIVAEAVAHGLPQMDRRWHGRFLRTRFSLGRKLVAVRPFGSIATPAPVNRPTLMVYTRWVRAPVTRAGSSRPPWTAFEQLARSSRSSQLHDRDPLKFFSHPSSLSGNLSPDSLLPEPLP